MGRGEGGRAVSILRRFARRARDIAPIKLTRGSSPSARDTINYQLILTHRPHLFEQLFYVMAALPSLCAVIALPSEARGQLNPVNKLTIKQYSTFTCTCRQRSVPFRRLFVIPGRIMRLGARCFTRPPYLEYKSASPLLDISCIQR